MPASTIEQNASPCPDCLQTKYNKIGRTSCSEGRGNGGGRLLHQSYRQGLTVTGRVQIATVESNGAIRIKIAINVKKRARNSPAANGYLEYSCMEDFHNYECRLGKDEALDFVWFFCHFSCLPCRRCVSGTRCISRFFRVFQPSSESLLHAFLRICYRC